MASGAVLSLDLTECVWEKTGGQTYSPVEAQKQQKSTVWDSRLSMQAFVCYTARCFLPEFPSSTVAWWISSSVRLRYLQRNGAFCSGMGWLPVISHSYTCKHVQTDKCMLSTMTCAIITEIVRRQCYLFCYLQIPFMEWEHLETGRDHVQYLVDRLNLKPAKDSWVSAPSIFGKYAMLTIIVCDTTLWFVCSHFVSISHPNTVFTPVFPCVKGCA